MMIRHRFLFILFIIIFPGFTYAKSVSHFTGKKFKAEIEYDCDEGNLTCNKVYLKSMRLKDKAGLTLTGKTINTNCPDVCDFQEYQFKNGKYNYSFYPSLKGDELWDYIVTYNDKVIAQDLGVMK